MLDKLFFHQIHFYLKLMDPALVRLKQLMSQTKRVIKQRVKRILKDFYISMKIPPSTNKV